MNKYIFTAKEDRLMVENLLKKAVQSKHFVPLIGNGFSKGTRTRNGQVPEASKLREKMIDLLLKTAAHQGRKKEDFKDISLLNLSSSFWREMEKNENQRHKQNFVEYISDNFTKVFDLSQPKRKFLSAGWRHIYTLNYDDAIEKNLDITTIIPFHKQNKHFSDSNVCLYKIHGDAALFRNTGDKQYCILSEEQYIECINNDSNRDMCVQMQSDFAANSIIFVGCSLQYELDVLFAADMGLQKNIRRNGQENSQDSKIIYLYYKKDDSTEISLDDEIKLEKYGVTDVVIINGESCMDEIYNLIYAFHQSTQTLEKEDAIETCRGIRFKRLVPSDERNLDYFFLNEKTFLKDGCITLPGYFIERTLGKNILKAPDSKNGLHIITGAKLSGKSYLLLQLLSSFPAESTYYITTPLNDRVFQELFKRTNCTFLLDQGVLNTEQIQELIRSTEQLISKGICFYVVVNLDDKEFFEMYTQNENLKGKVKFHGLKNKLDSNEIKSFNQNISYLHLVDYKHEDTLLDFLFSVEDSILTNKHKRILPEMGFLDGVQKDQIKAMIILAVENAVSVRKAIAYGILDALVELNKKYNITIQKDYLTSIETETDYSQRKYVNNSSLWVVGSLSRCARNDANHKAITEVYDSIVHDIQRNYRDNVQALNRQMKKYYFLDTLQFFYPEKGLILPYKIYEKLHGALSDNYQFLHQEAKCELRVARKTKKSEEILEILQKAYGNIKRALDIAQRHTGQNIVYTVYHMKVSKALILSNYTLMGKKDDRLKETIDVYHEAFVEGKIFLEDDFLKKEDMEDVKKFIQHVIQFNNKERNILSSDSKNKFCQIHEIRYGKKFFL